MKWMKKTNRIPISTPRNSFPFARPLLRTCVLALPVALALISSAAILTAFPTSVAAKQKAPVERVVDGKVTNKSDAAISGAVVYLKDSRSLAMKTYITDEAGHFHFGQLSQNTDYELWAVSNGARSKSKAISSFDDKSAYNFTLKVDTAK